jgi:hypothetical protein
VSPIPPVTPSHRGRSAVAALAFLLGCGASYGSLEYAGGPVEPDGYFHLAIARDYSASPFEYSPRLAEGVFRDHPADREPFFHLILAILLRLGLEELTAARLMSALACGLIASILYLHSGSLLVAAVGLLGSSTSFFRLLMCRPHLLAILCVLLGLICLLRGRYRFAAALSFVYTLSYSVPVLLVLAAFLHSLQARTARGLIWVGSGLALGLLLHPHFPSNLTVLWYQGFHAMGNALAGSSGIPVPGELLPWSVDALLIDAWLPLTLLVLGALRRTTPWWLLGLQVLLLALTFKSIRFIEYLVPLVALTAGPTIRWLLPARPTLARGFVIVLLVVAGPLLALRDAAITARRVAAEQGIYRGAALWLRDKAAGGYVLNLEWDAYPELLYFGGTFSVAQGLDPVFVAAYDPERFRRIARAAAGELSASELRREYPARFVLARRERHLPRLESSGEASIKYQDARVTVFDVGRD